MSADDQKKNDSDASFSGQRGQNAFNSDQDLHTGGEPEEATAPELDPHGSDPESNVVGRSKPASDGVAQHDHDKQSSNG